MATMDYKGYELYQTPTKEFDLQKPSTYNFAQSLNQGFAARNANGGLINDIITGAMNYSPLGVIPAVITAPYDRQSDFLTTMNDAGMNPSGPQGQPTTDATVDTGTLAGAVNMGNGLIGLPNGNVMDHTGSVVGGVVTDGNGNPVSSGNGNPVGWGMGIAPNYGSTPATGTVETLSPDDPMGYGYGNPTGADLDTGVISNSDPNAPGNFGYGTTATTTAPAPVSTAPATRGVSTETAPSTSSNDSGGYGSDGGFGGGVDSVGGVSLGGTDSSGGFDGNTSADSGGDGGGDGGGGDSCVIATHAVASGAFSIPEKRRAVRWCVRNLHGNWWGETIRKGYRYHGKRRIASGHAHEHYQEFRDYIAFATGGRRTLRTAWTFAWRNVQFFLTGLFLDA
jgi:hypothetical protein